jgi:hypothetical protein
LLTLTILVPTALGSGTVQGKSSPLSASATKGGLRLTISIPHASYQQNALALVTLTLQNVGRRPVSVERTNSEENSFQPGVEARDDQGNPSSLPTAQHFFPMTGPMPTFWTLKPGHAYVSHRHLVLSGPQLVASESFGSLGNETTFSTPPIEVALTPSSPPALTLNEKSPRGLSARLQGPAHGHLYFTQSVECSSGASISRISQFIWTRAKSTTIWSPCTAPSEWHLIAGYPGRPVGTLDYKNRG